VKNHKHQIVAALSIALAACGGGGDSGGSGTSTTASDPVDKYLGVFVTNCFADSWITDASTGATLFEKVTVASQSKASATKALYQFKHEIYNTNSCSGSPRATLSESGTNNWINVDGSATVAQGTADKVSSSEDNKMPGISGSTVTVSGITYNGKYLAAATGKDLYLLTGNDLYDGDFSKPLDAQGYPTALGATAVAKKQ
jgi:hypothetical protein